MLGFTKIKQGDNKETLFSWVKEKYSGTRMFSHQAAENSYGIK